MRLRDERPHPVPGRHQEVTVVLVSAAFRGLLGAGRLLSTESPRTGLTV